MTACTCNPTLIRRSVSPWTCPHGNTFSFGVPGDPYCWTLMPPPDTAPSGDQDQVTTTAARCTDPACGGWPSCPASQPATAALDGSNVCLRELVVTCGTAADPAWIDATHVLCLRPLPCNNPHHKPDAGWEVAATGGTRAVPPALRGQR